MLLVFASPVFYKYPIIFVIIKCPIHIWVSLRFLSPKNISQFLFLCTSLGIHQGTPMSCRVVSPRGQTHLLFYSYIRIRLVIQHASTYTKKISFVICLASGPLSRSKSNFIRVHNNHFWYVKWPLLVMDCNF